MKYSDILPEHVYTVLFDPVKDCEFDGKHLAIVIKKNDDGKTAIVVPLTSSKRGEGISKINIGKLPTLPDNLKNSDSFMVYNQVRTVNHDRFITLKNDKREKISCSIDHTLFVNILSLCSDELLSSLSNEEAIKSHYLKYVELTVKEVVETSYKIKRLILDTKDKGKLEKLEELKLKIKLLNNENIHYESYIGKTDLDNGILDIINKCLDETILEVPS